MITNAKTNIDSFKNPLKDNLSPIITRVIIGVILFIWIASIPAYLLIIYMLQNSFFSYDILLDGIYANGIFILSASVFFLGISVLFYGFLLFLTMWIYNKFKKKTSTPIEIKIIFLILFLLSIFCHYILIKLMFSLDSFSPFIPFILLSLCIITFFLSYINLEKKEKVLDWKRPLIFLVISVFIPINQPQFTSDFVSIGLHIFKVGGGVKTEILDKSGENKIITSGKLLLLSPEFAYLKDYDNKLVVVPLTDQTWLKIW